MDAALLVDAAHHPALGGWVVRALLALSAEAPPPAPGAPARVPLTLALVLDRSGSMEGEPLDAARRAAAGVVRRLRPDDVVGVVAYDDQVTTVAEPATGAAQGALARPSRTSRRAAART
jgi:Ca-activated chloride channel family protein